MGEQVTNITKNYNNNTQKKGNLLYNKYHLTLVNDTIIIIGSHT